MKKTPSRGKTGPAGSSPFSGTIFLELNNRVKQLIVLPMRILRHKIRLNDWKSIIVIGGKIEFYWLRR